MVTVFHDLQHKRHPEYFRWFDLPFWNFFLWMSAKRSRGLIAVSEATRDDLQRFYGVDAVVIHHGVEREFFEIAAKREPKDYLLCVSTSHPHKNSIALLRAFGQAGGLPYLVLTGVRGFAAKEVEELAGESVKITGWIPRERALRVVSRGARVHLSIYIRGLRDAGARSDGRRSAGGVFRYSGLARSRWIHGALLRSGQ